MNKINKSYQKVKKKGKEKNHLINNGRVDTSQGLVYEAR